MYNFDHIFAIPKSSLIPTSIPTELHVLFLSLFFNFKNNGFFKGLYLFYFPYMSVSLHVCMCTTRVPGAQGGHLLELEFLRVASSHVGSEKGTYIFFMISISPWIFLFCSTQMDSIHMFVIFVYVH